MVVGNPASIESQYMHSGMSASRERSNSSAERDGEQRCMLHEISFTALCLKRNAMFKSTLQLKIMKSFLNLTLGEMRFVQKIIWFTWPKKE
jgi:hypothetical protein